MRAMEFSLLSASYKNCAVEIREKLAVSDAVMAELIQFLKAKCGLAGVMVLSTCNRVEVYFEGDKASAKADAVEAALLEFLKAQIPVAQPFLRLNGREAINHVFRVTSSLESMVIGEPQITGQMKDFFHLSVEAKGPGFLLNQLMNKAFATAKRVRTETAISKFAVSISFAATELAKRIFDDLAEKTILIIGAGEMAELAAQHLVKAGCSHVQVANRTFSRAVELAEKFNGSAVRFESLEKHLESADIVISSTGAKGYVVDPEMVAKAMKRRKLKPMFLIDIAVPRDIAPGVNEVPNAYLYDIDDLQSVVDANLAERKKEAEKAQDLIIEELDKIDQWLATLEVVPTLKSFRESILDLANQELDKGLSQLGDLTQKQERVIRQMVNGLAYKVLHQPTVMLKQKAREGAENLDYVQALIELFALEPEQEQKPKKVLQLKSSS